jgi:polyvinyl alcohol dehydrogenase (cytochrome)
MRPALLRCTCRAGAFAAGSRAGADGAAVFEKACASCHQNPGRRFARAQPRRAGAAGARDDLTALTTGNMFRQGSALSDADRRAVSGFLAGRPVGTAAPLPAQGAAPPRRRRCGRATAERLERLGRRRREYALHPAAAGGVTAPMMPRMKLKWAFGFAGVSSARSQPAVLGGRVFVGSESGDVFALDAKTGCTHWSYHAQAGIRTAVTVGPYKPANGPSGFAVFFADGTASAYAIDAATGKEIWTRKLDSHPYAKATGSVTVHDGRVYVPLAGVGEEGQGGTPRYECCTFRGSVTALNANTGAVIWKTYTVDELKSRGKNKEGVALWGPAAAGSGRRRRSMRSGRPCTSPPATATPIRRSSPPTRCSRSTSTPGSSGGRSSRWSTTCGPGDAARTTPAMRTARRRSVPTTISRRRRCS